MNIIKKLKGFNLSIKQKETIANIVDNSENTNKKIIRFVAYDEDGNITIYIKKDDSDELIPLVKKDNYTFILDDEYYKTNYDKYEAICEYTNKSVHNNIIEIHSCIVPGVKIQDIKLTDGGINKVSDDIGYNFSYNSVFAFVIFMNNNN